ncbi:mechanosensitive ion channel domain-containing protein [Psychromarinibacter sp. S121]|uniref:mechanosensitive ion channel domain-containing protein n=1 Tax=Psychromarinibacter sp. S121 TaxID=3415127 RepID=UPI003C7CDDCA
MRRILFLACLLLTLAPLTATAQDTQPSGTIETENNASTDAAIAVRIREILGQLDGYADVTVQVNSGIVTLRGRTLDGEAITRLDGLVSRVAGVVAIENEVVESTDLVERLNPAVDRFRKRMEQLVAFLPLLVVAAMVFLVVAFIGFLLARGRWPWDRLAPNAFIADIYRQIVRLAFLVGAVVIALDILNATALLGTILGAAGIIGLAIGFAVRDTVENFIASVLLSIRQPFRPNDAIEINGDEGKVIRLTSRATILLSWDGNHIRIPNSTVFKSRIVNFSRNKERRILFQLGLDPDCDYAAMRKLAEETVQALPFVLDTPAASVWIEDLTDSGVVLTITGWIDQNETSLLLSRGEALRQVKLAVEAAGVTIADTTYRVLLDGQGAPDDTPEARPSAPPPPAPAPEASTENVAAESEHELERIVEAERAETAHADLLDRDARTE